MAPRLRPHRASTPSTSSPTVGRTSSWTTPTPAPSPTAWATRGGRAVQRRRGAIHVSSDIADGLAVAHRQGIVHRDLKPSNVLFRNGSTGERVLLADFGIARSLESARGSTIAAGTPHYMAPEQAQGRAERASDVYAAAVILHELLVGDPPFPFDSAGQVLRAQLTETPADVRIRRPDVPAPIAELISRGLSLEPEPPPGRRRRVEGGAGAGAAGGALAETIAPTTSTGPAPGETDRHPGRAGTPPPGAAASVTPPATPPPRHRSSTAGVHRRPAAPADTVPCPATAGEPRTSGGPGFLVGAVVVIVALIAAAMVFRSNKASAGEIILAPKTRRAPTRSRRRSCPPRPPRRSSHRRPSRPSRSGATGSVSGSTAGLYGGTRQLGVCDPGQLVSFLQANQPRKARRGRRCSASRPTRSRRTSPVSRPCCCAPIRG